MPWEDSPLSKWIGRPWSGAAWDPFDPQDAFQSTHRGINLQQLEDAGYLRMTWSFLWKDQSCPHEEEKAPQKEEKSPNKVVFLLSVFFFPLVTNLLSNFVLRNIRRERFSKCILSVTLHFSLSYRVKVHSSLHKQLLCWHNIMALEVVVCSLFFRQLTTSGTKRARESAWA